MERKIINDLLKWKDSPYRKPLILKRCPSGRKNMDTQRIWKKILRKYSIFQLR